MRKKVEAAFSSQSEDSNLVVAGKHKAVKRRSIHAEKEAQSHDDLSHSPFPLSNLLSRRLSNMSNFSSTSSSMDDTSSDENGIADNEDDSGEAPHHISGSSLYGSLKKKKGKPKNKKQEIGNAVLNKTSVKSRNKSKKNKGHDNYQIHQQNFKSIQKGIDNILKSDVLLNEDLEEIEDTPKNQSYIDDDEDSIDSSTNETVREPLSNGACSRKKAKALINCFRSFAVKPK
jgi:hypothetical protein